MKKSKNSKEQKDIKKIEKVAAGRLAEILVMQMDYEKMKMEDEEKKAKS
jgi:hypothetical protein